MISTQALAFSILALASLPNGYPVKHMRLHPLGPEGRATQLAELFIDASRTYRVDPFALTALAWSESNFDGTRVGAIGELGIMQLNPRQPLGRAFIRYRARDQADRDRLSIYLGADALRHGLMVCGHLSRAISFYKSGHCRNRGPMAHRVLITRARLIRWAGGENG